VLTKIC